MADKGNKGPNILEAMDKTFTKVEQLATEFNLGGTVYGDKLTEAKDLYPDLTGLLDKLELVRAKMKPGEDPDETAAPPYALKNIYEYLEVLDKLIESYREILTREAKGKKTFAMPSHDIMLSLICIFSGKPTHLPKSLLDKPAELRTPEEKQQAQEFINSIIQQDTHIDYGLDGKAIEETSYYSIITDNPKVKAWAGIDGNLFENDHTLRREAVAAAIKKIYGALGLRHLMALLIGLEEAQRTGSFMWRVNDHLKRLGKNPNKAKQSYETEDRKQAIEILEIFTSLFHTIETKEGRRGKIKGLKLFSKDGFDIDLFDQKIVNEGILIRATDEWYRNAIAPPDGRSPMFTQLLRNIATESHQNHPLTIFMAPLFAIMWRINATKSDYWELSIEGLMKWCDLDMDRRKKAASYNKLITELQYMTEHGYLGSFAIEQRDGGKYKDILKLNPPEFLHETNKAIAGKRAEFLPEGPKKQLLTREEFTEIFKASGLNQKDFGNSLGVSQQTVSFILTGARKPSSKLSNKVREVYPQQG